MVAVLLTWTGWSVKGERWGRGQSKPSSMPAVIPSEPLQTTDSCGSWSLHLWDNGLKFEFRWLHVSWSQLCLPWRWQRRWTDLNIRATAALFMDHNTCISNNCPGVLINKWTLFKFSKGFSFLIIQLLSGQSWASFIHWVKKVIQQFSTRL